MAIGKSSWQLILALFWIPLAGGAGRLAAQYVPPTKSPIVRIAEEREQSKSLPRNLAWNPSGKSLSFIRTDTRPGISQQSSPGAEIWSIDTATGHQKLLVSAAQITSALGGARLHTAPGAEEDDGARQLQNYAWAPNGHALLLGSGTSLARYDLDAHSSRPLVTDKKDLSNPQFSPDGRFVSFLMEHTLWLADATTGVAHAFTPAGKNALREGEPDWVYLHELGLHSAYWWSPDSSAIAWMETDDSAVDKYSLRSTDGDERSIAYPKPGGAIPTVHLFVQAVSGRKALQIDLGSTANAYIPMVQWLPDGKHLAIERLSRSQKTLDLLLADAATGKVRTILTEKDAYWINLSRDLHFLKDARRFLWSSERSGHRHLYLYDISGRELAQLTQGDWEVTSLVGSDETAGAVYFTATKESPLERQLYRVNEDGSGLTRITPEKGTHDLLFSPAGDAFVDTWSNHATRPRQELLRTDGSRIASLSDKAPDDAAINLVSPIEYLTVKTHLGLELNAWMMKPSNFNPARQYPVIFYVAGGPGEQIVRDAWGGDISQWFSLMTQKGYIVFAVDNRGSAGRGHLFEEPVHLRFSGAEMADLRDGVQYLHSLPWIDKTRIGICGWGYGGFLTLHGMLDRPLLFKAGFAGSPITDWHLYDAVFAERYLEDPERNQDGWLASSPLENAKNLNAPLMLAQATLDETVHQENSLMLLDELLDNGKYADLLLFPDRRNLFEDYGARLILFQRLTDFFVKNL
ncbi:MAG: DPP IV N-terminal domain-containing protein [Terracidiphilus sp.]|nr:DPP IV N-terminal domain-containing protein [Terracidiphilus sp.]